MKLISKFWNKLLDGVSKIVKYNYLAFIFIWLISIIISLFTKNSSFYIISSIIIALVCLLLQFHNQREYQRDFELKYNKHKKEDQEFESDLNFISTFNVKKCESIFDIPKRILVFYEKYNKRSGK